MRQAVGPRGPEARARQATTARSLTRIIRAARQEGTGVGLPRATEAGTQRGRGVPGLASSVKAGRSTLGGRHEQRCATQPRPHMQQLAANAHGQSQGTSPVSALDNKPFEVCASRLQAGGGGPRRRDRGPRAAGGRRACDEAAPVVPRHAQRVQRVVVACARGPGPTSAAAPAAAGARGPHGACRPCAVTGSTRARPPYPPT